MIISVAYYGYEFISYLITSTPVVLKENQIRFNALFFHADHEHVERKFFRLPELIIILLQEMKFMLTEDSLIRSSGENVIELIKDHRDDLLQRLSDTELLKEYLSAEFHITQLSTVKLEFIKRALHELHATSIDLSHYAALILETRKKGSLSISAATEQFFRNDIERTIKNYL